MEYNFIPILERIKMVKKNKKITTDSLSSKSGIPMGTLSKILAGITTEPKIGTLISLANALDVSVDFLLYGDRIPTDDENDLRISVLDKMDTMEWNDEEKQAIARMKKMPLNEQQEVIIEALLEKYKSLSVKNQEAIATIIDSLYLSEK